LIVWALTHRENSALSSSRLLLFMISFLQRHKICKAY
jgi:hypothetical protein